MEKILLPVDGSEASLKAVRYAVELASTTGATLELLHVVPSKQEYTSYIDGYWPELWGPFEKSNEDHGREVLDQIAKERHDSVEVTTRIEKGYASDIIVNLARRGGYKMIVMGSKGANWLMRMLYGSICRDVVEHAACPVLVVH